MRNLSVTAKLFAAFAVVAVGVAGLTLSLGAPVSAASAAAGVIAFTGLAVGWLMRRIALHLAHIAEVDDVSARWPARLGGEVRRAAAAVAEARRAVSEAVSAADDLRRRAAAFDASPTPMAIISDEDEFIARNRAFSALGAAEAGPLAGVLGAGESGELAAKRLLGVFSFDEPRDGAPAISRIESAGGAVVASCCPLGGADSARMLELRAEFGSADAARVDAALRAQQIYIELDPDGRVIFASDRARAALGAPDAASLSSPFVSEDGAMAEMRCGVFAAQNEGGAGVAVRGARIPLLNEAGDVEKVVCFGVVADDPLDKALPRARTRLGLLERAAIIEIGGDDRIRFATDAMHALLGCAPGDLSGVALADLVEDFAIIDQARDDRKADGVAHWRRRDGARVALSCTAISRDANAGVVSMLCFEAPASATKDVAAEAEKARAEEARATEIAAWRSALDALGEAMRKFAEGDLDADVEMELPAAFASLRDDFDQMRDNLRSAIDQIVDRSGGVGDGAREISRAADDLSRRTESQAAALEQTVASLKKLTEGVQGTADDADTAEQFTGKAARNAKANEEVVGRSLDAMRKIEESSDQISQIIGVIDDIAFQTNLLALNAGVEAARAGDAGRGFAVVASEVRALAQRCSDAAREIKALISASSSQVKEGVELVSETSDALGEILSMVAKINELVSGISGASREQSTGVREILSAMDQLDEVTQKNAAMVEEMTAAGRSLKSDSAALSEVIARFGGDRPGRTPVKKASEPARKAAVYRQAGSAALSQDAGEDGGWEEF